MPVLSYRVDERPSLHINQAPRECRVVEVLASYSLAVYTMPNGRAFLTRLLHQVPEQACPPHYYSNASKKERDRHEAALLSDEILVREDLIVDIRGQRLPSYKIENRCKEQKRVIDALKAKLEKLAGPQPATTAAADQPS